MLQTVFEAFVLGPELVEGLDRWYDFRTFGWVGAIKYPSLFLSQIQQLLQPATS